MWELTSQQQSDVLNGRREMLLLRCFSLDMVTPNIKTLQTWKKNDSDHTSGHFASMTIKVMSLVGGFLVYLFSYVGLNHDSCVLEMRCSAKGKITSTLRKSSFLNRKKIHIHALLHLSAPPKSFLRILNSQLLIWRGTVMSCAKNMRQTNKGNKCSFVNEETCRN